MSPERGHRDCLYILARQTAGADLGNSFSRHTRWPSTTKGKWDEKTKATLINGLTGDKAGLLYADADADADADANANTIGSTQRKPAVSYTNTWSLRCRQESCRHSIADARAILCLGFLHQPNDDTDIPKLLSPEGKYQNRVHVVMTTTPPPRGQSLRGRATVVLDFYTSSGAEPAASSTCNQTCNGPVWSSGLN